MTLCEVITWIAFGHAVPKEKLGEGQIPQEPATREYSERNLNRAAAILIEALRGEKLRAIGRKKNGSVMAEIPAPVFWNQAIAVNWWDTIEDDFHRVWFTEVKLKTGEVLANWPVEVDLAMRDPANAILRSPDISSPEEDPQILADYQWRMARRRLLQEKIIERIRRARNWVSISEIADWCARDGGSIQPDENLRSQAYQQIGEALRHGEFGTGRRSRVLFLHPSSNRVKMTQSQFSQLPFGDEGRADHLRWCWLPIDLAAGWFDSKNLLRPAHLFPAGLPLADCSPSDGTGSHTVGNAQSVMPHTRRRPVGINYEAADAPLLQEMKRLIDAGKARNCWDAALAVASDAKGYGSPDSKAKRLASRFSAAFRADHD